MNSHFSYRGSAPRTKERIRKKKYEIERCNTDKCNSDHNETFLCFHSERWKLRQKKESTVRVFSNCMRKMRRREAYMCGIYLMYIELQIQK